MASTTLAKSGSMVDLLVMLADLAETNHWTYWTEPITITITSDENADFIAEGDESLLGPDPAINVHDDEDDDE